MKKAIIFSFMIFLLLPGLAFAQLGATEILRIDVQPAIAYPGNDVTINFYIRQEGFVNAWDSGDFDYVRVQMFAASGDTVPIAEVQESIPEGGATTTPVTVTFESVTPNFGPGQKYEDYYFNVDIKDWPLGGWKRVGKEMIYFRNGTPPNTGDSLRYQEYAESAFIRYMALIKIKDELEWMSTATPYHVFPWNRFQDFTNQVIDVLWDIDGIGPGILLDNLPPSFLVRVIKIGLDAGTFDKANSHFYNTENISNSLNNIASGSWYSGITLAHMMAQVKPVFCSSLFAGSDCAYTNYEGIIGLMMQEEQEWLNIHTVGSGGGTPDFTTMNSILDQEKTLVQNNQTILYHLRNEDRCPITTDITICNPYYYMMSPSDREQYFKFVNNDIPPDVQDGFTMECKYGDPFDPCVGYINRIPTRILSVISVDRINSIKNIIAAIPNEGICLNPHKIGSDVRITNATNSSNYSSLVWTGSEYGVSWYDYRDGNGDGNYEIYFARISAAGVKIGSDVRITNATNSSYYPSLVWTGSEYGVSWFDNRDGYEIYFARISAAGVKIGSDVRITNYAGYSRYPSLVWTGSEYGVSWDDSRDGNSEIYFARISAAGVKIGSDLRITNYTNNSFFPSLVWTGSEYGVSWDDYRDGNSEIYFARISAAGVKIGSDVRIKNNASTSNHPSLVWTGSEYGVSWYDNRDGNNEIYFARISAAGVKIGSDVRITNYTGDSYTPSLVWTGSEYGVSWDDYRDGKSEIYFARISAAGVKIGSDVRITNYAGYSRYPSLVWTGSEYGVSWDDSRDGNYEIYFARIGCCVDGDIDGYYPLTFSCEMGNDCDDSNFNVNPGVSEICNGIDDNCSGQIDEGLSDFDSDGFSAPGACSGTQNDCDDYDDSRYPGAPEILCDLIDQNCNGFEDDDRNQDGDGYSICSGDCNDFSSSVYPGAIDNSCDSIDQNCDGFDGQNLDEDPVYACYGDCNDNNPDIYPGKFEFLCDGIDQDCDGLADDDKDDDLDGLSYCNEILFGTSDSDPDSDDDGLNDGLEVNVYFSSPTNPDSDNDGLNDGQEVNVYSTNPIKSDTDDDFMPDGWEVQNGLLPLNSGDASIDPDNDGRRNLDEYLRGFDPNSAESKCGEGVYCFAESDGNGLVEVPDLSALISLVAGITANWSQVLPHNGNQMDLDGNGIIEVPDYSHLISVLVQNMGTDLSGQADQVNLESADSVVLTVGQWTKITVNLTSAEAAGAKKRSGLGVIFYNSSGTGSGEFWGGDGSSASRPDGRYCVTGEMAAEGGRAYIWFKATTAGTLYIQAEVPASASKYTKQVQLGTPVKITIN